jgi:hypothetical protein
VKPVIFRYHALRAEGGPSDGWRKQLLLAGVAERNGFRLEPVFVSLRNLGDSPCMQRRVREWVENHAGVRVLVVQP